MSHGLTCRYVRADESGKPDRTAKAGNIPGCTNIHDRLKEADGRRSGDREMDTMMGRNGKGAILTLTERLTDSIPMKKSGHGMEAAHTARTAIRLPLPYGETG